MANTIEPTICGGDAAFLSNYFDHSLNMITDSRMNYLVYYVSGYICFMVALWNRETIYIFILFLLSSSSSFFFLA